MNDLISRQEAVQALVFAEEIGDMKCENLREVLEVLNRVPPTIQWISVTERLPKFDEVVLVWVENKDPNGRFRFNNPGIHTAQLRDKVPKHDPEGRKNIWGIPGYDSEWTVWGWSYFSEPDIKAWMPLPEPYREVE